MLYRIQKAVSRKPRRQNRGAADTPELQATVAIMDRNEKVFARAFIKAMRELYSGEHMRLLKRALASGERNVDGLLNIMPWFNEADPDSVAFWARLMRSVIGAYERTLEDAGQFTVQHYGFPMKFKVRKAALYVDVVVPINPYSIEWVRNKSLSLIKDLSEGQEKKLRALLLRNFEEGVRHEAIIEEIEAVVGLTETQAGWVAAREELAISRGIPAAQARANAKTFASELLTRRAQTIARTETVDAYTKGLEHSWQLASEEGFMPPGTLKVWEAMMDERTSDICVELDGQAVPVNQPFNSEIIGEIERPPAHPNCRSTMTLRFP